VSVAKRVVAIVFDRGEILDVAGPLEVFSAANHLHIGNYELIVASTDGGAVRLSNGMTIETVALRSIRARAHTLIIGGGIGTTAALGDAELLRQVKRLSGSAGRVASVCTGAFLLATTKLLDGHRATTHWQWCDHLQKLHPAIHVDPEPIFVRNGSVWTSAGVTCGIDLALAMLEDDHGSAASAAVARQLVVYVQRSGGQSQFTAARAAAAPAGSVFGDLMGWIANHLSADLSVGALAARVNQSPRHFARLFKQETGQTPGDYVEAVRVERARGLLEATDTGIASIASQCGFGTVETMHRVFRRRLNTTPGEHRRHFAART
jgi:transcriptional regulator GlxA family with amidase domain